MIKKSCIFVTVTMLISMISFSQTIKGNIEKQFKDPKTQENAAKADVFILGNKERISDSSTHKSPDTPNRIVKNSRKKKKCRKS